MGLYVGSKEVIGLYKGYEPLFKALKGSTDLLVPGPTEILSTIILDGDEYVPHSVLESWSIQQHDSRDPDYARFEVRSRDEWATDAGRTPPRERAEFNIHHTFAQDIDIWFSWDQVISGSPPNNPSGVYSFNQCVVGQWHTLDSVLSPSPFFYCEVLSDGSWAIKTRGSTTPGGGGTVVTRYRDTNFEFRRRYHHVCHCKFSATAGVVEWWRDGIKIVDISGIPLGYPADTAPYPKIGIYRTADETTMIAEYYNPIYGTDDLSSLI